VTKGNHFFQFLERALQLLALEAPEAYRAFCNALSGLTTLINFDGERRFLGASSQSHKLSLESDEPILVTIVSHQAALRRLLDGQRSLLESVTLDDLSLQGSTHHLVQIEAALFIFVQGMAQSRRAAELLRNYLTTPEHSEPKNDQPKSSVGIAYE
jgi:hypothetical protein